MAIWKIRFNNHSEETVEAESVAHSDVGGSWIKFLDETNTPVFAVQAGNVARYRRDEKAASARKAVA